MSDRTDIQTKCVQKAWTDAFRKCCEEGVDPDLVARLMLELSCGALKGTAGSAKGKSEVIRIRDDIWAELTLLSDRFV